jgi:hypothetical protein
MIVFMHRWKRLSFLMSGDAAWLKCLFNLEGDCPYFDSHGKQKSLQLLLKAFVPQAGIEPAHLTVHDFESCASTNSATKANGLQICGIFEFHTIFYNSINFSNEKA